MNDRIGTAGSCFAQHISRHLRRHGFNFIDAEPPPELLPQDKHALFGFGVYSARYANVYTTAQLRQLIERSIGRRDALPEVWRKGERFYDPFRTMIEPDGFSSVEELEADTKSHLRRVFWLFKNIDVLVFTLGLTEAWRSKATGTIFPIAPGVGGVGSFDAERHEFINFNFGEVYSDLAWSMTFLKRFNPRLRFLLTVSPVPLAATASGCHVLTATTHSKSILRSVAGQLTQEREDVIYFPSYEVITSPAFRGMFFHPDMREIAAAGVSHIMEMLFEDYCEQIPNKTDTINPRAEQEIDADVACEERILSFYGNAHHE